MKNPLSPDLFQAIDFAAITADHIDESTRAALTAADLHRQALVDIPAQERTYANTLDAFDDFYYRLSYPFGIIYLLSCTTTDKAVYEQSLESIKRFQSFFNRAALDEGLYQAIRDYAQQPEAQALTGYQEKFLRQTLESFERNGFALPAEQREELRQLRDQLDQLENQFQQNIALHQDALTLSEAEMDGLPDDYKAAHRNADGTYTISLDYPSYRPFMRFATNEQARKALLTKYLNRAAPQNLDLLEQIVSLRKSLAQLLGYPSFAAYQVAERMAKTPDTVWAFEDELQAKVRQKADADYAELLEIKREQFPDAQQITDWESAYWKEKLLQTRYQVDSEAVKAYFPLRRVIEGIFTITEQLYSVRFLKVEGASLWHPDVSLYELWNKDNTLCGRLYLDPFPRPQKYKHAACFPIVGRRQTDDGVQVPTAALVCNFPKPTDDKPSLLTHNDVETLFHEFGHGLHHLLTRSPLLSFSGTNVKRDFVEVPSQHFENWVWNYEALQHFAKHYESDAIIPEALFQKMVAARNVGSGLFTLSQILYGKYDFDLHDRYDPQKDGDLTARYHTLQQEITPFDPIPDTHFPAGFGHLTNYAAGYYGYLWARVFAEDVFAVFEREGVLSPEVGQRYLDCILSRGGTVEESQQLFDFLGRDPEPEAFLRAIGLKAEPAVGNL
ncbi:MAG: M3 family metallopeptidase [Bernardetiaceae bacterium]